MDDLRTSLGPDDYAASRPCRFALAVTCAVSLLWSFPVCGQANHGSAIKEPGSLIKSPLPHVPDDRVTGPDKDAPPVIAPDESCFMWPLTGTRSPTSGVSSLGVRGQTRRDFQRACTAAGDKKLGKAEGYLRKALRTDEKYPAAWVLLGQISKAQQKLEDAYNACSQALRVEPNYLPANLCLADLSAAGQRWEEMLRFANAAITLDPANDPHGYFYAAGAYFGLRRLPEAERSALRAVEIDKSNREPRSHFLLAQIYEIQHKPDAEAVQLQQYLNAATDPQDVAMVKKYLDDLTGSGGK